MVAVVGADNKVDIRRVKPSERVGSLWVIQEGLQPGERVIAEGIQKVRQGAPVTPKPYAADAAGKAAPASSATQPSPPAAAPAEQAAPASTDPKPASPAVER